MIKNSLKYIAVGLFGLMLTTSCTDEIMNDINKNLNNPTQVPSRLVLTDVINRSAASVASGDYNMYASLFVEHQVGVDNQFYNSEIRTGISEIQTTTYNNAWVAAYTGLRDAEDIIAICSEGGIEQGNHHTKGMALVLKAYFISVLTDGVGEVPFSQAVNPDEFRNPTLDKQQNIYGSIFSILDEAIAELSKETTFASPGDQDVLFSGDAAKWLKFAHGLKARAHMRLSFVDPSNHSYQKVLDEVALSFTSVEDEARYEYNGATSFNPVYLLFNNANRYYYGSSKSFRDNLDDNDPRIAKFFIPNPNNDAGVVELAPNGLRNADGSIMEPDPNKYGWSSHFKNALQPSYLMSFHELKFLEAEAKERMSAGSGETAAKEAITEAFKASGFEDATEIDAYINSITDFGIDRIMREKYISFFEAESIEAYNDLRRLRAMGETSYITLQHAIPENFPLRFTYGAGDVNNNPNVKAAQGDGRHVYSENVWWAGGKDNLGQ
ncbi:SusD/RagB family nutrient-binding outer membrane lipoprotein [Flammeovirga yaeyamensis]|uniref:SusD/RagB family nutrient-binding outer membrane lipoprotein n=1 Tax=Flammeovirga yaeyamensis TaxID=367791 RepID=A0AAX1N7V7_9BACT|nr:SusD/RagB family nutrient-binding outer membrane lipoprotein [Flammeovirga yaeyamensis]MBB3701056.1 hypothetical protein [Flammeovirga yaeyamensis]NMF38112.1 SusD/RagB family nutrient-binding outer membrane lipoprotein [Flammeovirga yaeyamensis]QWG01883.1 SusD/RagB family nutrient-binding outer membrane lipoprotein [Flammeovirga yaeyamensis]